MSLHLVHADHVPPQAWRNGGGTTRELLCWPTVLDCALRVSVADITRDGPFSSFPGIERWFAVIEGAGVALDFGGREHRVSAGDPPLRFDGAAAPDCQLLAGSTRDLNLMLRGGEGVLIEAAANTPWKAGFTLRGLFTAGRGRWSCDDEARALDALSLLWSDSDSSAAWSFTPDDPGTRAWWLGFTPESQP